MEVEVEQKKRARTVSKSTNNNVHNIIGQLRHNLLRSRGTFNSLEKTAGQLGMSGRTLRRQLQNSGTSFQHELDLIRQNLAIDYLMRSDKRFTEIAYCLGFCDSSAFSKAFKTWTGMSPRAFKRCYRDQFEAYRERKRAG